MSEFLFRLLPRAPVRIVVAAVWLLLAQLPFAAGGGQTAGPQNSAVQRAGYQETRYVSQSTGSDSSGDGSRRRPWASVSHALIRITAAGPSRGFAVLVAGGSYRGTTVSMKPYVDLYGGHDPTRWTRDLFAHRTVLDGEETRRVVIGADHARLDGFFITGGRVRGKGAGLLCERTSPVISNNVFAENRTLAPVPWKPANIHELANDGGAIACLDHASPRIENNLFARNSTENGRGGALACHQNAAPRIAFNVFLENISGLIDPARSSDGGALSVFQHSSPEIIGNVIVRNRALHANDAGGIFVALWSSPLISGNTLVGNEGADDAGALFIGGQEHRYDQPLDPVPPADKFNIKVAGNIIIGNTQAGEGRKNSGAMRITMESRATLENNIIAENPGGVYLQRSEVLLRNNTLLDDLLYMEEKETVAPGRLVNNILRGRVDIQNKATLSYCDVKGGFAGTGNFDADPGFLNDGLEGTVVSKTFDAGHYITILTAAGGGLKAHALAGRAIQIGGQWSVVQGNDDKRIIVWGSPEVNLPAGRTLEFRVPPTYGLRLTSPCIDRGSNEKAPATDFKGSPRPIHGGISRTVDVGADEYNPAGRKK